MVVVVVVEDVVMGDEVCGVMSDVRCLMCDAMFACVCAQLHVYMRSLFVPFLSTS